MGINVNSELSQQELDKKIVVIFKFIDGYFSKLTVEEIVEAFRMYVARKFPDVKVFRMIDCVSVSEVLNAYIEYRDKAIAPFIEKRKILLNAPLEKTEAEKEQIFKEFVTMVYNEIQEEGYSKDSWQLFSDLEKSGFIKVSNDEKHLMYKRELAKYTIEERKNIKLSNPINFKQSIKEFESQIKGKNKLAVVQNRCRSILVSEAIKQRCKSIEILFNVLNEIKKNEKSENAT